MVCAVRPSLCTLFALGLAMCLGTVPAFAEPLPKDKCDALAAELSLLEGGGAAENLLRGPEWAKSNLTAEQIGYVRRLIAVREDLAFRCQSTEFAIDPTLTHSAPADAPLPSRKPAPPPQAVKTGAGVPAPMRPERVEATSASPPPLRGTLPATAKAAQQPVPAPQKKAKPVP